MIHRFHFRDEESLDEHARRCAIPLCSHLNLLILLSAKAPAMAIAPLMPVPATRHTTVLYSDGLTGVKYGPSSLTGMSAVRRGSVGPNSTDDAGFRDV